MEVSAFTFITETRENRSADNSARRAQSGMLARTALDHPDLAVSISLRLSK